MGCGGLLPSRSVVGARRTPPSPAPGARAGTRCGSHALHQTPAKGEQEWAQTAAIHLPAAKGAQEWAQAAAQPCTSALCLAIQRHWDGRGQKLLWVDDHK